MITDKKQVIENNQSFFQQLPYSESSDFIIEDYDVENDNVYLLRAPISYFKTDVLIVDAITGGCGPGDFGDEFVPDTLWGLSVTMACRIHDWTFQVWNDDKSFKVANDLFLKNMYSIIKQHGGFRWLQALRRMRARKYHYFVSNKRGKKSYKDNHLKYILD